MKRVTVLAVVLCTVAVLFSFTDAIGQQKVRGVTDTDVVIGQWGPQTGPAAVWGTVARGTGHYFQMLNDEGGIHGRKIKYVMRDDSYQPSKTKAVVKEMVEEIGIFAAVGGVGTSCGMAVREYLTENKVVWVSPASGSSHWTNPFNRYIFSTFPQYFQEAYVVTQYAIEKMGKKKIAFFYQNDDYGKEALDGAKKYLSEKGMSLVAEVPVEVTDTDLKSHGLKLKQSEAEVVIVWVLPKHGAMIVGVAKALGFSPQFIASSTLSDPDMMFKITKGLWKDVMYSNFVNMQSPLVKKYLDAQQKYGPTEEVKGLFYLAGYYFAEPLVKGLQLAGKDLNPDTLIKAMESIKDWSDWLGYGCTFTATEHQGVKSVYLEKCGENGERIKVSDWLIYKAK